MKSYFEMSALTRIKKSPEFKNIFWMVADRVWRMLISLVVGVWVIRYLGPQSYGQINYVLAYIGIATVITTFGMESFLLKELLNSPDRKAEIIYSAFMLRLAASCVLFLGILVFFYFTNEPRMVYILFFLLVPQLFTNAFAVVDLLFQAELRSRITIICRNVFFVFNSVLKIVAVVTNQSIYIFSVLMILDIALADIFLFFYFRRSNQHFGLIKIHLPVLKELLSKSIPFLLSSVAIIIYMKVDQILLGKLASPLEVGYFTASTKIPEIFYFMPLVITGSLYGVLINSKKESFRKYMQYARKIFFGLVILSVLISFTIFFFAEPMIVLLFGKKFMSSVSVLQVNIWALVFIFAGVIFNQLLVIEDLQKIVLYKTLIGLVINVALNLILIPYYGAIGAAVATLVTQFFSSVAANMFFPKSRALFLSYFVNNAEAVVDRNYVKASIEVIE